MALYHPGVSISGCTSQSVARVPVYLVLYVHHCAWPDVHHSAWVPGSPLRRSCTCPRPRSPGLCHVTALLCLPRPLQPTALRCACALALVCIVVLLGPDGAVGEELQGQQHLMPRVARWLSSLSQFNKYMEKLFNSRWAGGNGRGWEETDATCPHCPTPPGSLLIAAGNWDRRAAPWPLKRPVPQHEV